MFHRRCFSTAPNRIWLVICQPVLLLALSGCAGGGGGGGNAIVATSGAGGGTSNLPAAPTIAGLVFMQSVLSVGADGTVTLKPSFTYTSKATLATATVAFLDSNGQQLSASTLPISGVTNETSGTLEGTFVLSESNGVGNLSFRVSVTDTNGSRSNELTGTFQIIYSVPTLKSINPNFITMGSPATQVAVSASGATPSSTLQANGGSPIHLDGINLSSGIFFFTIPATNLASTNQLSITLCNPGTTPSNPMTISVAPNPIPTLSFISSTRSVLRGPAVALTVSGSNFLSSSVVLWNGSARPTTFTSSNQLSTTISAKDLQTIGVNAVTVFTPGPGGGTSAAAIFATFLPVPANDLVFSSFTQLLYASVPSTAGPSLGNTIVSIDPNTGALGTPIFVGSDPTKMAISSDGKTIWVVLNGAAAVRKVDLVAQTAGLQFNIGGGTGNPSNPVQALAVAVMPGSPNTVAVAAPGALANSSIVTIYDNGVPRANAQGGAVQCCAGVTGLAFDPTGTTLYEVGLGYGKATIDSTGITSSTSLNPNVFSNGLRVDNGLAYLTTGQALNADTGSLSGTFLRSPGQNADGPEAPDSTVGRAFIIIDDSSGTLRVNAYDTSTFLLAGAPLIINSDNNTAPGPLNRPLSLVRWGQDGLAFTTSTQIYIAHTQLVRDLSTSLSDLGVTASAATVGTTGTNLTYTLTVQNSGPLVATPATLIDNIPDGSSFQSATASQGICTGGAVVYCDLGNLNSGNSASAQITVTLLRPGTLSNTASVSAPQGDSNPANNSATSATAVTGPTFSPTPVMSVISPSFVQAGSASFTLTVNGSGFVPGSVVMLNSTPLSTSYASATQLAASVDASSVASLGWAWINVQNPSPGGGNSASLPLTTFKVVSLDVNRFVFDPFTRKLYATVPSTATQVAGNSLVAVDPATGSLGIPLAVGSQPNRIAESSDGKYVYIGLDGSKSITRVDLTSLQRGPVFPIIDPSSVARAAGDLAVAPDNANLLAIDTTESGGNGVGIFDFTATSGAMRPDLSGLYPGSTLAFANGSTFYSWSNNRDAPGPGFNRWTVTSTGMARLPTDTAPYWLNGFEGFRGGFRLANSLVYGFAGGVADPTTTPPTQLGRFQPDQLFQGTGVAPDPASGRVFLLINTVVNTSNPVLLSFDSNRYVPLSSRQFTGLPSGEDLVRWGRDGLAWHTSMDAFFGAPSGSGKIILMRGPFVLPQWNALNPTPALFAASPANANAGSGNLILTVTGAGFVPGAVVLWNGAERSSTFVDSSHLSVAIPASDLSQGGTTATLVVNSPGSSNSNSISFSIN